MWGGGKIKILLFCGDKSLVFFFVFFFVICVCVCVGHLADFSWGSLQKLTIWDYQNLLYIFIHRVALSVNEDGYALSKM